MNNASLLQMLRRQAGALRILRMAEKEGSARQKKKIRKYWFILWNELLLTRL